MPLDTHVAPVAPAKPVSRSAQRTPQRQDASHGGFAAMLHGHGHSHGAKSQKHTRDSHEALTADAAPKKAERQSEADKTHASSDTEAKADKGDAKTEHADAPKKTALSAEDLPAQSSTLQLAGKRGDHGGAARGLDALKGRHAGGAAGAHRAGELKDTGKAAGDAATTDGFRSSLLAARQAGGDSPADAASMSLAAAPVAERASERESDGSLPSLAGLSDLGASRPASAASADVQAPPVLAQMPTPPDSPLFPHALGMQLSTWMDEGVSHAKLELNPADLGPIEVRIAVHEGATRIELGADVASTRSALTDALPRLAEQLGDVGLSLSGGSVSDQTSQGQRQADSGAPQTGGGAQAFGLAGRRGHSGDEALDRATMTPAARTAVNRRGLLDLYA